MSETNTSLFISTTLGDGGGSSSNDGYAPSEEQVQIYLNRLGMSESMGLMIKNQWIDNNTYTSLLIEGILGNSIDAVSLAMPDVLWGKPNTFASLYIGGGEPTVDGIDLSMESTLDSSVGSTDLVGYHNGGESNTYTSCHIIGVLGIPNDTMTMSIPDVYGDSNENPTLFTKGY